MSEHILTRIYFKVRGIGLHEGFVARPSTEKYEMLRIRITNPQARLDLDKQYGQIFDFYSWCAIRQEVFMKHWIRHFGIAQFEMKEDYIEGYSDAFMRERYLHCYDHQLYINGKWVSGNK